LRGGDWKAQRKYERDLESGNGKRAVIERKEDG
jgi:hypothetical protein